jgi:hypothetical protein
MAKIFEVVQFLLALALPIAGFYYVRRRSGHTRGQLIAGAALGGGLAGALIAARVASAGSSFLDGLPWALVGLAAGAAIGLAGVLAFALGRWLSERP